MKIGLCRETVWYESKDDLVQVLETAHGARHLQQCLFRASLPIQMSPPRTLSIAVLNWCLPVLLNTHQTKKAQGVAKVLHALTLAKKGWASRPGRLTPKEIDPGIHWSEDWVGLRATVDTVGRRTIYCTCLKSNPESAFFQPLSQSLQWLSYPVLRNIF